MGHSMFHSQNLLHREQTFSWSIALNLLYHGSEACVSKASDHFYMLYEQGTHSSAFSTWPQTYKIRFSWHNKVEERLLVAAKSWWGILKAPQHYGIRLTEVNKPDWKLKQSSVRSFDQLCWLYQIQTSKAYYQLTLWGTSDMELEVWARQSFAVLANFGHPLAFSISPKFLPEYQASHFCLLFYLSVMTEMKTRRCITTERKCYELHAQTR